MPHHLSEEQIARFRGRQIPPAELPEIDDHLSMCADCRGRLASASDLRAALQRASAEESSSALPEVHLGHLGGEHLAYEQLEAYVDKRSSRAERELVRKHVEVCRTCANEVRDMDAFKTELASSAGERSWNLRAWWAAFAPSWFTPSRIAVALAASAIIVLVVSLERMRLASPPLTPSAQNTKTTPTGASPSGEQTLIASSGAAIHGFDRLSPEERHAVIDAISQQTISFPNVLVELQPRQQILLGESQQASRFDVLAPLGEVVPDVRPLFRWEPVAGASSYSVAIFDANLNPVQSSASLHATEWTPDQPLNRGQLYEWQVTAKLGGGNSLSAPSPPSPEAKFRVLDQEKADEIAHFQEANPESHIVMGILYAQTGLLEPGEHELEQVPKTDPKYGLAQNLLKSIREIRHPHR